MSTDAENTTKNFWQSFLEGEQPKSAADQQAELYIDGFMSLGHEEEEEEEDEPETDRSLQMESVPVLQHVQQQQQVLRESAHMKDFMERDRIHPTPRKSPSEMNLEESLRQKPVPERFSLDDFMSQDSSAFPMHRRSIDSDGDGDFGSNDHEIMETPSRTGSSQSNNDMVDNQKSLYVSSVRTPSATATTAAAEDSGNNSPGKEFLEKLIQFEEKNKADGGGDSYDLLGDSPPYATSSGPYCTLYSTFVSSSPPTTSSSLHSHY